MSSQIRLVYLIAILLSLGVSSGCNNEFYLSEKETIAYSGMLATESSATQYFDNLRGRSIDLQFDNSTGVPRLQSTNLLTEMRRTEMAQLETGAAPVSLARLNDELQRQIGNWIDGRLQLYTSSSDSVRLTQLDSVQLQFLENPTFIYRADQQAIEFDVRFYATITGTIEVHAINSLLNFVLNIFNNGVNGSYPLRIEIYELRLHGKASILSPYANAGRIRFQLIPELVPHTLPLPIPITLTLRVVDNGAASSPDEVRTGIAELLKFRLTSRVDEVFDQDYYYFLLSHLSLSAPTPQTPTRLAVTYRSKAQPLGPESTDPSLHVVTRGSDGKLYQSRRGQAGWSNYTLVPFPSPSPTPYPSVTGDPALCYSGAGQMELAATDEGGNLLYAHWRDEAWGNWQIVRPNTTVTPTVRYRGRPAVTASAPGQAEIVVVGSDGRLWHARRVNGVWVAPAMVPLNGFPLATPPYRDPVAVQAGNKVAVVFVDSQNRIQAILFDLETGQWGQPSFFPATNLTPTIIGSQAPAAVASGDERIDVVYLSLTGIPRHRILEIRSQNLGITFAGNETVIGGTLTSSPVLVAAGYRQLDLIGRFVGNRLRSNHFVYATAPFTMDGRVVNPGWQGWGDVNGNLSASGTTTDEQFTDIGAAATPSGRVELIARGNSTTPATQLLFHNSFESQRYGTTAWKAVHWRGYEASGLTTAAGRPAVVAIDRNFQVGVLGIGAFGPAFNYARISGSNATNFLLGIDASIQSPVVDPIVLSSGPMLMDYIYIGADGRLRHFRLYNHHNTQTYNPTVPIGLSISGISAQSYGNGYIELTAFASDNCIYHWRFRDGAWSNATGIACSMRSTPALIYTGAGKLELLAVDFDHKLFRWHLIGGSWGNRLAIASTFRINEHLFSETSAASWGDGTVDVVVTDIDTRGLHHRRIGPDDELCTQPLVCPAPRVFTDLGGPVDDKPVFSAFGPANLNVLTMAGLQWYSNWAAAERLQPRTFPPQRDLLLRWSGFQFIGGSEMVVGSASHTGVRNYAAFAVDFSGRIFINRYENGRWTNFRPVVGQKDWMRLPSPVFLPQIVAYAD